MVFHSDGTVTLTETEFNAMQADAWKYNALRNHGVDNWCGWDDAMQEYRESQGEED
jgi:hypothetical protein